MNDNSLYGSQASAGVLKLLSTNHATKGKVQFGNAATTMYDEVNDRLGIGTASPSVPLHVKNTASQLRLDYDGSNYLDLAVAASGHATLGLTGSAVDFSFSPMVYLNGGFSTNSSPANANLFTPSNGGSTATSSAFQINGFNVNARIFERGSSNVTGSTGFNLIAHLIANQVFVEAGSGTHYLAAGLGIKAQTLNNGTAATTNAATLFIEGKFNGTASITNNYAAWVAADDVRFDGKLMLGGITAATAYLHLPAGTATAGTAPLKLTSGTLLSVVENGAIEFDGSHLYITIGGTRLTII